VKAVIAAALSAIATVTATSRAATPHTDVVRIAVVLTTQAVGHNATIEDRPTLTTTPTTLTAKVDGSP